MTLSEYEMLDKNGILMGVSRKFPIPMQLAEVETYADLAKWLGESMPSASLHELDGEVIIHTGLTVEMNGELMPVEEEGETCPDEGDIPIEYCTCKP